MLNVYLKTMIFVTTVPGSVAVYIPFLLLFSNLELAALRSGLMRYLGLIPMSIGLLVAGWSIWSFASRGMGSPAMHIDEPKYLVVTGFHKFVRNPMYIGVALILLGEALFFQSATLIIYLIFWIVGFHLQVVYHEEPHLKKKFGTQYEEYLETVPRWIPKLTRKKDVKPEIK